MDTKEIQRRLAYHGFYQGDIDGLLNPETAAAIINFKSSVGLRARDYVGPLTLAALRADSRHVMGYDRINDPVWLKLALTYLGQTEKKGPQHNQQIISWWQKLKLPFRNDEVPWCAAFVGGVLEECGILSTRSALARSYTKWGNDLKEPVRGAIVIFWRGSPKSYQGHVAFVLGQDTNKNLVCLGGNQGDKVSIDTFDRQRVLGYRWPKSHGLQAVVNENKLPIIRASGKLSTDEA